MQTTLQHHQSTVQITVKTCIVLHNLMMMRHPTLQLDRAENVNRYVITGDCKQYRSLQDIYVVAGSNTTTNEGRKQRNLIKLWANSEAGSVSWQDRMM